MGLTEEQELIVKNKELNRHCLILACPGSGKTTTMIERITFMIKHLGCKLEEFFIVTFTHNASLVLKERLARALGKKNLMCDEKNNKDKKNSQRVLCGTFHDLSGKVLFDHGRIAPLDVYHVDELQYKFEKFLGESESENFRKSIKYLFVDEYQDVNKVQFDIVNHFRQSGSTVVVVGDDDQNIYSFRGSSICYIQSFSSSFPNVCTYFLSINFRSIQPIIDLGTNSISKNPRILKKPLSKTGCSFQQFSSRPSTADIQKMESLKPILLNHPNMFYLLRHVANEIQQRVQVKGVPPDAFCVLSRCSFLLNAMETLLLERRVPTLLLANDSQHLSPAEDTTQRQRLGFVSLCTVHSAKGEEWKFVYIVGLQQGYFPDFRSEEGTSLEEERRLFYVGITRAKFTVTLCNSSTKPSLFIKELNPKLVTVFHLGGIGQGKEEIAKQTSSSSSSIIMSSTCEKKVEIYTIAQKIRMLNGNHYIHLKKTFLPRNLGSFLILSNEEHRHFDYKSCLRDNHLEADFHLFLERFARRIIAKFQGADSIKDHFAHELLEIDQKTLSSSSAASSSCSSASQPTKTIRFIPLKWKNQLMEAYNKFQNLSLPWETLLWEIFLVSQCERLHSGRTTLYFLKLKSSFLEEYKPFLIEVQNHLLTLCDSYTSSEIQIHPKVNFTFSPPINCILSGHSSLLFQSKILVDLFYHPSEINRCPLSQFVHSLVTASLFRLQTPPVVITHLILYNVLFGQIFYVPIQDWEHHQDLCTYLNTLGGSAVPP